MHRNLILTFALVVISTGVSQAEAQETPVCVRNYTNASGPTPCDAYPMFYSYVPPTDVVKTPKVCTRIYAPSYCAGSAVYVSVETTDGKTICVLNNEQPPVSNLCQDLPSLYAYIKPKL